MTVGGGGEPSRLVGLRNQFVESGFDDGWKPRAQPLDFGRHDIHADDLMAVLGQTRCSHATDITQTKDTDFHTTGSFLSIWLTRSMVFQIPLWALAACCRTVPMPGASE